MSFVVGVDGGGSRTRAVVLDEAGAELGRAEGPGSIVVLGAHDSAVAAVALAVRSAAGAARVDLPAAVVWAGLAGAGREEARAPVEDALSAAHLAERVIVGTDVEAAFHDAFGDGVGVLLIAGTGSIALGRGVDGALVRVGGWGRHLGDEGGGFAIGMSALRSVLRTHDGRDPATRMTEPILERCGVSNPADLVAWIESASKADVAALVPIVAEAAGGLDGAAARLLEHAVGELESCVGSVLERTGPWAEAAPLAVWGGLLAEGGPLGPPLLRALERYPVTVSQAELDPPRGSARLALRLLGATA